MEFRTELVDRVTARLSAADGVITVDPWQLPSFYLAVREVVVDFEHGKDHWITIKISGQRYRDTAYGGRPTGPRGDTRNIHAPSSWTIHHHRNGYVYPVPDGLDLVLERMSRSRPELSEESAG
jgi:hypothetical protein